MSEIMGKAVRHSCQGEKFDELLRKRRWRWSLWLWQLRLWWWWSLHLRHFVVAVEQLAHGTNQLSALGNGIASQRRGLRHESKSITNTACHLFHVDHGSCGAPQHVALHFLGHHGGGGACSKDATSSRVRYFCSKASRC